jgi:hypothetical protein
VDQGGLEWKPALKLEHNTAIGLCLQWLGGGKISKIQEERPGYQGGGGMEPELSSPASYEEVYKCFSSLQPV